jgi:hypothetical protein
MTYVLVNGAAEGVAVVALAAGDTTDGEDWDVQVGQSAAATENVGEETIAGSGGVTARGLGSLGARLDRSGLGGGVAVHLRGGEDGGGESSNGDNGELHFCGGGGLLDWLVGGKSGRLELIIVLECK